MPAFRHLGELQRVLEALDSSNNGGSDGGDDGGSSDGDGDDSDDGYDREKDFMAVMKMLGVPTTRPDYLGEEFDSVLDTPRVRAVGFSSPQPGQEDAEKDAVLIVEGSKDRVTTVKTRVTASTNTKVSTCDP